MPVMPGCVSDTSGAHSDAFVGLTQQAAAAPTAAPDFGSLTQHAALAAAAAAPHMPFSGDITQAGVGAASPARKRAKHSVI